MKQLAKLWDRYGDLMVVLVLEEMDNGKPAPVTSLGSLGNLRVKGRVGVSARDWDRAGGQGRKGVRH